MHRVQGKTPRDNASPSPESADGSDRGRVDGSEGNGWLGNWHFMTTKSFIDLRRDARNRLA